MEGVLFSIIPHFLYTSLFVRSQWMNEHWTFSYMFRYLRACSLHSSTVPHSSWKSTLIQISKYINIDNYTIYNFNATLRLFKNPQEGYLTRNSNLWSRLIRTGGGSLWGSFELLGWTESAWRFSAPLKQCRDMGRWLEPRKYLGDCQVERHLPKHVVLGFRVWKGSGWRKVAENADDQIFVVLGISPQS